MKRYFHTLKCDPFTIIVLSILISVLITSCVPNANDRKGFRDSEKWGKVIKRDIQPGYFTKIRNCCLADIIFTQSDTLRYTVEGNEKALDHYTIEVEEDSANYSWLVIRSDIEVLKGPSIRLYVSAPSISMIHLCHGGDIDLKDSVTLDSLWLINTGYGDIDITQLSVRNLKIDVTSGDVRIRYLNCSDITAKTYGGDGDIKIRNAQVDGNADLFTGYKGDIDGTFTARKITALSASEGDIDIKVDCDTISINSQGSGDIEVEGQAKVLQRFRKALGTTNTKRLRADKIEWVEE